jgi:hypothetical protein
VASILGLCNLNDIPLGLRVSLLGYSCNDTTGAPITYPVLPLSANDHDINNRITYMRQSIVPSGGKCPEQTLQKVYADMLSAPSERPNRGVVLFTNGFFPILLQLMRRHRKSVLLEAEPFVFIYQN